MKDGIDESIGFNPNCTLEALALADNPEELAKQEEKRINAASELSIADSSPEGLTKQEEKQISVDLELPIFDDVEYKLAGQILKINIGDPKMKPLMRHMGALLMKCGSGLITGKKKGWLSFISSDSDDIKKARNLNCHYNYFQKSNDKQALELFKAVLSGTDSILDYLQK